MSELQVDQGHKTLKDLIAAYGSLRLSDANEAETRFKVIDGILEKVLGWQKTDISLEDKCADDGVTEFADYTIKTATTSIVIEAKRAGASFALPNNHKAAKMGGAISSGQVGEAVRQVRQYCIAKSAQFAVATNGSAWVVFPAIRTDGISFDDTQARIFRSLEDIEKRFVEFWELLSRQRVIEGNLEAELLSKREEKSLRRTLSLLKEPDSRISRNTLYPHLSHVVTKVLTDEGLLHDPGALEFCYIKNTERVGFDSKLKMYLLDAKPHLGIAATRVRTSKKSYDFFDKKIAESKSQQSKFFLLLGPVGAGKSTFLAYTRNVSARSDIDKSIVWLYIDFKQATQQDSPREFIYSKLLALIEEDKEFALGDYKKTICPAYQHVIDNLARGALYLLKQADPAAFDKKVAELMFSDRSEVIPYVDRIISYAAKNRPFYITIDNVDQIEDDKRQNEIFAEAQALAKKHQLNIIISLRDTTYRKYRAAPTFDAFEVEAIYIDPPSVVPVLSRRFTYARKLLQGQKAELTLENGLRFKAEDIGAFFEITAQSLLSVSGAELLNTLAGGNIRRGLTLAREFLSSGHVTADKALESYLTDRDWRFPDHEIFKGAVLGGRRFYREEDCLLANMFCAKLGIPSLQLLRLHIADYLVHMSGQPSFEGVPFDELVATLHQVGVAHREIEQVIRPLLESSIIRTVDGAPLADESRLLPTRLAGFLTRDLMGKFNYAEMCAIDAHIYDDVLWEQIKTLTAKIQSETNRITTMRLRIKRVEAFVTSLVACEEKWVIEAKRRNLGSGWIESPIRERIQPALQEEYLRVLNSAQRNSAG